jgi:hypothetical protein
LLPFAVLEIKPARFILWRQDNWHTVVYMLHFLKTEQLGFPFPGAFIPGASTYTTFIPGRLTAALANAPCHARAIQQG